jgi:hypothetical protein
MRTAGRHLLVGAAVVVAVAAVGGRAAASPRSSACTAGTHTVSGATVRTFCGPAHATVKTAGRTFTFSTGQCALSGGYFSVNIGSITLPPAKPKFTYLGIDVKPAKAGAHSNQIVSWQVPGTSYSILGASVTVGPGLKSGSFSGRVLTGGTASGSFSCT